MAEQFDKQRFEGLVLFIAHRREHDARFGRTKLAKVLFYSDFDVYRDTGASLTGASYIRMPFGPFPKQLEETEKALDDRGLVYLDYVKDVYEEKRIVPRGSSPDVSGLFEPWALHLVGTWADRIASATARQISQFSHHHPGWLLAETTGQPIPYETSLLPQERPTGLDAERAKRIASERRWLSDAGWIWERNPHLDATRLRLASYMFAVATILRRGIRGFARQSSSRVSRPTWLFAMSKRTRGISAVQPGSSPRLMIWTRR